MDAQGAQVVLLVLLVGVTFWYARAMVKSVHVMQIQTLNQQGQKVEELYLLYPDIYSKFQGNLPQLPSEQRAKVDRLIVMTLDYFHSIFSSKGVFPKHERKNWEIYVERNLQENSNLVSKLLERKGEYHKGLVKIAQEIRDKQTAR